MSCKKRALPCASSSNFVYSKSNLGKRERPDFGAGVHPEGAGGCFCADRRTEQGKPRPRWIRSPEVSTRAPLARGRDARLPAGPACGASGTSGDIQGDSVVDAAPDATAEKQNLGTGLNRKSHPSLRQGKRRAEGVNLNTLSASGSKAGDVDPGGASGISRGSQNGFFPGRSRLLPALSLHPALALNKGPRGRRRKHGEGPERRGTREAYAGKRSPLRVCRLPRDLEWLLSLLALQFREMTFSCARRECYFKRLEKSLEWLPKIRSLFQRPQEATSRTLIPKRRPRSGMWLGDQFGIAKLSAFIKAETPWLFKTFDKDFL
nr:uncharacterized protein LOC105489358 [Macaca nemestrina]